MLPGSVVDMADKAMHAMGISERAQEASNVTTTKPKHDPSGAKMQAVHWTGNKSVSVSECPKPAVTDDSDVVIRITSTAICGSDLHLYVGCVPGMKSGQVLGHEPMGIVESVGPKVTKVKPGDRVVIPFCLACGECWYCKHELFSSCERTNPSVTQEKMMGARTAGLLGHPELMGGIPGGQAEFLRVPFGDVNCLKVPPQTELPDEKVLFLSDILPTAWHGTELARVQEGDVVAIWGAGPVGLLTAQCAFARGAKRVIIVDNQEYRLDFAKKILPKIETVDFSQYSTSTAGEKRVLELCQTEPAGAPDCCVDCVGMHYAHSTVHKLEMAVGMETDSPEALNACIMACRKGGRIAGIGAYAGLCNHFNIGAFMEKCLEMRSGQTPVQKYWKELLEKVRTGKLDPSVVITHRMPLKDAAKAYQIFDNKDDNVIKIVLSADQGATAATSTQS
jgi:threonine dehydrogenase-like Zn-dependent dehydrogenase